MSTPPPPLPAHNPYAAPMARLDDIPEAELVLADRLARLGAVLLDSVMVGAIGIIAAIAIPAIVPRDGGEPNPVALGLVLTLTIGGIIALLVVNLIWLHRYGQTIGKRIVGVKVLRSDGSRCSLPRIVFARWLPVTVLSMIPLLGYVVSLVDPLMIFREDRRCLHDLFADTIVVKV